MAESWLRPVGVVGADVTNSESADVARGSSVALAADWLFWRRNVVTACHFQPFISCFPQLLVDLISSPCVATYVQCFTETSLGGDSPQSVEFPPPTTSPLSRSEDHHFWLSDCELGRNEDCSERLPNRGRRPRAAGGVLGEGQQAHLPHQLGDPGERCELPSGVRGGAPTSQSFPLFSALRLAFPDTVDPKNYENSYPVHSWVSYCEFRDVYDVFNIWD